MHIARPSLLPFHMCTQDHLHFHRFNYTNGGMYRQAVASWRGILVENPHGSSQSPDTGEFCVNQGRPCHRLQKSLSERLVWRLQVVSLCSNSPGHIAQSPPDGSGHLGLVDIPPSIIGPAGGVSLRPAHSPTLLGLFL